MSKIDTEPKLHTIHLVDAVPSWRHAMGRRVLVLRGTLQSQFLRAIVWPVYQRLLIESGNKHNELISALDPKDGIGVPDALLLCSRTSEYEQHGTDVSFTTDALYTLDGLQRTGAAIERLKRGWKTDDFAVDILMGTSLEEEVSVFTQVNLKHTEVSSHNHLRNAGTTAALEALREMAESTADIPLLQWDAVRPEGDSITAHMFYEVAALLHGSQTGLKVPDLINELEMLADDIGTERLTENVRTFFQTLDKLVEPDGENSPRASRRTRNNVKQYSRRAPWMRGMAMFFGRYANYWTGSKLTVTAYQIDRIGKTPWDMVSRALEKSNGAKSLCDTLAFSLDSGARDDNNRLVARGTRKLGVV